MPDKEYSNTVRHQRDSSTELQCTDEWWSWHAAHPQRCLSINTAHDKLPHHTGGLSVTARVYQCITGHSLWFTRALLIYSHRPLPIYSPFTSQWPDNSFISHSTDTRLCNNALVYTTTQYYQHNNVLEQDILNHTVHGSSG